jgi:SAM-dependent methyltransferase
MNQVNIPNGGDARSALEVGSPSVRWRLSDLWRAPLTDLPVRDELIRQYVPRSPRMKILEIGPGSGFPAFRMAREVGALTLMEVAAGNAAILSGRFAHTPNVEVVVGDVCGEGPGGKHAHAADAIIAIEVFELLPDPTAALANMAGMLRPQGSLFMQFPNYENPRWPTFYRTREGLEAQLRAAGFTQWKIYRLRLSPWSQFLFHWLHEVPLQWFRALRQMRQKPAQRLEDYDGTWAFHHGSSLEAIKVPIHFYWAAIMMLMRLGGDVFRRVECGEEIFGMNLFVVASTGGKDGVIE